MKTISRPMDRHRRKESEKRSENCLIELYCGGIKLKNGFLISCKSKSKVLVPMTLVKSAEMISHAVSKASWKALISAHPEDRTVPIISVQCVDCWINEYRIRVAKEGGVVDTLYKDIDPSGKYWDRMQEPIDLKEMEKDISKLETSKNPD